MMMMMKMKMKNGAVLEPICPSYEAGPREVGVMSLKEGQKLINVLQNILYI